MTSTPLVCDGCGNRWTDAELIERRAADPNLISCCPERKMVPHPVYVAQLQASYDAAETESNGPFS